MKKALIAMSGGVDSSAAAYLVSAKGFDCIGCTMKLYGGSYGDLVKQSKTCCSLSDVEDARSVAYKLNMPYYVFNFTDDFEDKVIKKFVSCYENGATPNPCIDCNRYMKFDKLYERAKILGCEYVVTGHYAIIEKQNGKYILKKGKDSTKDQSYVLYSMNQNQLSHTLFPLGNMLKSEIRELTKSLGFVNADKPDSQDICFVPDGNYAGFLEEYTDKKYAKGNFVDIKGNILGEHKGIIHYTVGQRKGLGLSFENPMYVCKINPSDNTVVLGESKELFKREVNVEDFNWISGEAPESEFRCKAKIRYRQKEQDALIIPSGKDRVKILFDEPQRAITKGQSAVLYDGDIVLGGGTIV